MKKFLIATAVVASTASAQSADLKAPYYKAPAAQVYDWTGFYIGANVGIGIGQNKGSATNPAGDNLLNLPSTSGAVGGGQVGYNYQSGHWLVGAETDIQSAAQPQLKMNPTCPVGCNSVGQIVPWFGTVRGRVGYASGPVLTYVTGGYAYGSVKTSSSILTGTGPVENTSESMRSGWTWGSGVEAALGGNWTGKIEYLYVDLGNASENFTVAGSPRSLSGDVHEHIFRTGLNYRFGGNNAAPAALSVTDWRGFYLGGNGGSGLAHNKLLQTVSGPVTNSDNLFELPSGFVGGVQIGYNWQTANWVYGIEADFQGSTQKDDRTCLANCAPGNHLQYNQTLPWFGTVRGRVGYSVGETLFYATGGIAYGEVKTIINEAFLGGSSSVASLAHTKTGWTAGGGIESPFEFLGWFGKNWTSKTEYLYVDLGSNADAYGTTVVIPAFPIIPVANTFSTHVTEHIFRTGLSYHFN